MVFITFIIPGARARFPEAWLACVVREGEGVERVWFAPGCSIFGPVAKERVLRCAFQMKGSNESFVWKCVWCVVARRTHHYQVLLGLLL